MTAFLRDNFTTLELSYGLLVLCQIFCQVQERIDYTKISSHMIKKFKHLLSQIF